MPAIQAKILGERLKSVTCLNQTFGNVTQRSRLAFRGPGASQLMRIVGLYTLILEHGQRMHAKQSDFRKIVDGHFRHLF